MILLSIHQDSSRLSIGDLMNDMISLRDVYKLCTKELSSMKRDQRSKGLTTTSTKISKENEVEDPRKALFAAISSRSSKEDDKMKQPPDQRKALFAAIIKKKMDNKESDDDTSDAGVAFTPGVHRLQRFLIHSKSILSSADAKLDLAVEACKVGWAVVTCCANHNIGYATTHIHTSYFSFPDNYRVSQHTAERRAVSELRRHCCRCYPTLLYPSRVESRNMIKESRLK